MPGFKNRSGGNDRGGFKKSFGGGGFKRGGFGGRQMTMHRATCGECGSSCEVPFKPAPDRPVYCNKCFKRDERSDDQRTDGRDERSNDRSDDRGYKDRDFSNRDFTRDARPAMHHATCDECGNDCEVPFRPNGDKPVFCNQCFKKTGSKSPNNNSDQNKEQFAILNAKLDRILKALTATEPKTADHVDEPVIKAMKEMKEPKTKKKSKK